MKQTNQAVVAMLCVMAVSGIIAVAGYWAHTETLFKVALVISLLAAWLLVVCLPGMLARGKYSPSAGSVETLSFLGLLIPVLWLVALVWAVTLPNCKPDGH